MLVCRTLYDYVVDYNTLIVMLCFTSLIAQFALDILELILFTCSFHVNYVSKCRARNVKGCSLLFLLEM